MVHHSKSVSLGGLIGDAALEILYGLIPLPVHEIIQTIEALLQHTHPP